MCTSVIENLAFWKQVKNLLMSRSALKEHDSSVYFLGQYLSQYATRPHYNAGAKQGICRYQFEAFDVA